RGPRAVDRPGGAARLALIAFDESAGEGEGLPPALADRLAFHLALDAVPLAVTEGTVSPLDAADVAGARARLDRLDVPPALQEAMVVAALRYGVFSLRAVVLALRAARAQAALTGGAEVGEAAAAAALRLVILPRATCLPMEEAPEEAPTEEAPPPDATPPEDPPPEDPWEGEDQPSSAEEIQAMADRLLEAVHAELPPEVLASMAGGARRGRARGDGAGQRRLGTQRGRPAGVRPGVPGQGRRLALTQTLAAAAPWQALRRRAPGQRLAIRRDDLRIRRFKTPRETLTIFAVDASGSAALARLAEAKGAVELLLAEAYRRRDLVALVAFRGTRAEVLLPPTRALARARRALAALPGGGATPLGAGIDAAAVLARDAIQRGQDAQVILLTDGKGNVARDGTEGRAAARADTAAAAAAAARAGLDALVIDTAPRPAREARALAEAMAARYLALPGARAETIAKAARAGLEAAR
ncbi:MAG: VWA domain-containing protein, partial [Pseudomonadota bacterium]